MKPNLRKHWLLALVILLGVAFALFPYNVLDGMEFLNFKLEIKNYNELGDFIGGITAPFISLVATILLNLYFTKGRTVSIQTTFEKANRDS